LVMFVLSARHWRLTFVCIQREAIESQ
jgi:hypothetical protein